MDQVAILTLVLSLNLLLLGLSLGVRPLPVRCP